MCAIRFNKNRFTREKDRGRNATSPDGTRIGPIILDWKVNVTSLIAFIVSVFALFFQGIGYWHGSTPKLHPADKMLIFTDIKDNSMIRMSTRMVYTNDGAAGYNALVLMESVSFSLNGDTYQQWSEERGVSDEDKVVANNLVFTNKVDASPFVIPAMMLVSHETFFAAREQKVEANPWKNRLSRDKFVQALEAEYKNGIRTIDFTFTSDTREIAGIKAGQKKPLETHCSLTLDQGLINRMKIVGWTSRTCL